MAVPLIQTAFVAGEISPALFGHVDLAKFHVAGTTLRNGFVNYRGGFYSRAGTAFVSQSKQSLTAAPPRLIAFQYSITQGYVLEFGDHYVRFFFQGAPVIETGVSITGITKANPAVVTISNTYSNGDWVYISGVVGMTQINGGPYVVSARSGSTIALLYPNGSGVDSSHFSTYSSGGTASRVLTLVTPYMATDLPLLKYAQSADVMSLTHPSYPPQDLRRVSAVSWTIGASTFGAAIGPPGSCSVVATTTAGVIGGVTFMPTGYAYDVTTVSLVGEESIASVIGTVTNGVDIAQTAGSNVVTWGSVTGGAYFNIYRAPTSYNTGDATNALPPPTGSLFGYVGTSYGNQFVDSNITPDYTQVPPLHLNPFAPGQILGLVITAAGSGYTSSPTLTVTTATGSGFVGRPVLVGGVVVAVIVINAGTSYAHGDTVAFSAGGGSGATATLTIGPQTGTYPGVVSYFQQRRVYAGSLISPDTYWMSKPGQFLNFDSGVPVSPSDAVTGTPWGQQVNGIQFMLMMQSGLIVMTGKGAWLVGGAGNSPGNPQPITPSSQQATQQAFRGISATVPPIPINYDVLYVDYKQSYVYDITYNFWLNNYTGADLTELSSQLFDGYVIDQWAWAESPYKLMWATRNDGTMTSLAYVKEQEVYGWSRHDTFGFFWAVCTVTEPPVDAPYFVTTRLANHGDAGRYYIERMDNRIWDGPEDDWAVDCGLALALPTRAAALTASDVSGSVEFVADAAVFSFGDVGFVIRMGGGIALINQVTSTTSVLATLLTPITAVLTDLAGAPVALPQAAGNWTIARPVSSVSGLTHLAGLDVSGLADGVPIGPITVPASGTIALPFPATNVKIGLPFDVQAQSVYLDGGQPTAQGRRKTIPAVTVRVDASQGFTVGTNQPDGSAQSPRQTAPAWTNMALVQDPGTSYLSPGGATVQVPWTGDIRVPTLADWAKPGQVAVEQTLPIRLQVTAFIPETLPGDLPDSEYEQERDAKQPPRGPGQWMLRG